VSWIRILERFKKKYGIFRNERSRPATPDEHAENAMQLNEKAGHG
jgi:hypothetical protein